MKDDPFYDSFNAIFENDFKRTFIFLLMAIAANTAIYMACYVSGALISGWKIFKMYIVSKLSLNSSILNARMNFFDSNSSGRIINRLSNDMSSVDDQLPYNVVYFTIRVTKSIGIQIIILYYFIGL
jgi:ABC-type multidrug transport system fused ATPase/permease subunit